MQVSPFGVAYIRRRESCRVVPYRDTNGRWTIGWGHLLTEEPPPDMVWSPERCETQFEADLAIPLGALKASVYAPLSLPQVDALVSLIYNIGVGNFAKSTVLSELSKGDYLAAADAFLLWKDHGNALERRAEERAIFLYGTTP